NGSYWEIRQQTREAIEGLSLVCFPAVQCYEAEILQTGILVVRRPFRFEEFQLVFPKELIFHYQAFAIPWVEPHSKGLKLPFSLLFCSHLSRFTTRWSPGRGFLAGIYVNLDPLRHATTVVFSRLPCPFCCNRFI